jgi:hypothetical protein
MGLIQIITIGYYNLFCGMVESPHLGLELPAKFGIGAVKPTFEPNGSSSAL